MNTTGASLLVGTSYVTRKILQEARQVAPSPAPVLIRGEPGTGKSLVSELIHHESTRRDKPFIRLRCSEMSACLLERELFGHVRDVFPDAWNARYGSLENTRGGTIYFDEIAALAPATQIKLLQLLEEHTFEPLGSDKPVRADVRVLASTKHPLEKLVHSGAFRTDLFYRLAVFPIQLLPLRKHASDIPALIGHFITKYAQIHGKTIRGILAPGMTLLTQHRWPGNVRELEECIEKAILESTDGWLRIDRQCCWWHRGCVK